MELVQISPLHLPTYRSCTSMQPRFASGYEPKRLIAHCFCVEYRRYRLQCFSRCYRPIPRRHALHPLKRSRRDEAIPVLEGLSAVVGAGTGSINAAASKQISFPVEPILTLSLQFRSSAVPQFRSSPSPSPHDSLEYGSVDH